MTVGVVHVSEHHARPVRARGSLGGGRHHALHIGLRMVDEVVGLLMVRGRFVADVRSDDDGVGSRDIVSLMTGIENQRHHGNEGEHAGDDHRDCLARQARALGMHGRSSGKLLHATR